ncbi:MAG: VWA domain-containing protein [Bryobacteraceae bacterium]|jgi:VWFA-related protein
MRFEEKIPRRSLLSAFALWPAARLLRSQQPNTTFSADVKVVNLLATVRDKQGQIVRNLSKEDFLLDEDGRPQTIGYFSRETDLPLTLGLLVDTSGSQRRVLPDERSASFHFFEQVLRPDKDLVFVIHFDFEVELLVDLTASRQKLEKAIDQLQPSQPQLQRQQGGGGGSYPYPGGGQGGQRGGGRRGGGTTLYDAVFLAGDDDTLMKKQRGRKALIVLSDGVDTGSKTTLASAVESAQRADTLVYTILFADPDAYGSNMGGFGGPRMGRRGGMGGGRGRGPVMNRPDGKKVLEQISRETGGRFFEVSHKQPISKVYEAIEEDLRNQYSLGYTSDQKAADRGYRRIHLTIKQKGMTVQTREGYYPG